MVLPPSAPLFLNQADSRFYRALCPAGQPRRAPEGKGLCSLMINYAPACPVVLRVGKEPIRGQGKPRAHLRILHSD
jgi:hypothetical protein